MSQLADMWDTLKQAITAYTGLTPAAFFSAVAFAVAVYHVVSILLAPRPPPPRPRVRDEDVEPPLPPPVQLGEVTEEELKQYDGSDPKKPLLMAIKGQIYDVTQSRMFYGPGGPYALFAGKDASRALAKMSFEQQDLTGDISGLGPFELDALQDWEYKFSSKYVTVGTIKKTVPVKEEDVDSSIETRDRAADVAPAETEPSNLDSEEKALAEEVPRDVGSEEKAPKAEEVPREVGSEETKATEYIAGEDAKES